MAKFEIGDMVQEAGAGPVVEVLEVGSCGEDCTLGFEVFRFALPGGQGEGWEHASRFEKVEPVDGRHPFEDLVLNEEDKALLYTDGVLPGTGSSR